MDALTLPGGRGRHGAGEPRRPQAADRPENRDGRLLTVTPPFCASWSASASAAGAVFVAPASSSPSTSSAHDWKREREEVSKQVGVRARVRCSGDDQPLFVEKNAAFPSARRRPANRSGEGLGHNPCPDLFEVSPISLPSCGAPESTLKPLRLTSAAMVSRKVVRF